MKKKSIVNLMSYLLVSGLLTFATGCGSESEPEPAAQSSLQTSAIDPNNGKCDCNCSDVTKPCSCKCNADGNTFQFDINIDLSGGKTGTTTTPKSTPSTVTSKPTKITSEPKTPTKTSEEKPTTTTNPSTDKDAETKAKGRQILDKVMNTIRNANAYEVVVNKDEIGLENGKQSISTISLWAKSPNEVLIELTKSSNPSSEGTRIKYTTGDTKVKVRPSGLASFVTPTLDMNDERVVGPNNYTPAQADVFALTNRFLDPDYEAELTGKTTIDGESIYILKITSKSENGLDPKISYELLGFNPKDFTIKFWETYTDGREEPFLKMQMAKFTLLDSISDKKMKL